MMSDYLRKGFLLGLGAALAGKEKLEKKLDELVSKNEISKDEAKQMMNEFINKGEKKTEEWTMKSEEQKRKAAEELGLATKEDIASLHARITDLEARLGNNEQIIGELGESSFSSLFSEKFLKKQKMCSIIYLMMEPCGRGGSKA